MALLLLLVGCGPKKPDGFPPVFPCKVTVTKEGKPLADVSVILMPEQAGGAHASGGKTDSSGVAVVRTNQANYLAAGAPEGQFKIILTKPVEPEGKLPDEEVNKMPGHERNKYAMEMLRKANAMKPIIPPNLTKADKTPLKLSITSSGGELSVNIDEFE